MKFVFVLLSLFATSVAYAGELFIPVAFRGDGLLDSQWRTEIAISNISREPQLAPVKATITLHRDGAAPMSTELLLSAMEVYDVRDALHGWWSLTEGSGVVRITWAEPAARIAARARIYNVNTGGEYGQGIPAVSIDQLGSEQFLVGLSGVNGNRTNVGVSNPHETDVMIWIGLYDTAGLERGGFATQIPARSYRQYNDIFSYFQAGPLDAAMVRVSGVNGTVYAYASVVRNDSGDPTFIAPAQ